MPNTVSPTLYLWPNRTLYLGISALPFRGATAASDILLVALQGTLTFKDPNTGNDICSRSVVVRAGTELPIANPLDVVPVLCACYLDPVGQDFEALRFQMSDQLGDIVSYNHRDEATLIDTLLTLRTARPSSAEAYNLLERAIIPPACQQRVFRKVDPRVIKAVDIIRQTVTENIAVKEIADQVFLSESRLLKLFKSQVGIPIRRYRQWHRLYIAAVELTRGKSLLDAALAAGFSSAAHYSKCFSELVGVNPSFAFAASHDLKIVVPDP